MTLPRFLRCLALAVAIWAVWYVVTYTLAISGAFAHIPWLDQFGDW